MTKIQKMQKATAKCLAEKSMPHKDPARQLVLSASAYLETVVRICNWTHVL